jgi:hypothetical protein
MLGDSRVTQSPNTGLSSANLRRSLFRAAVFMELSTEQIWVSEIGKNSRTAIPHQISLMIVSTVQRSTQQNEASHIAEIEPIPKIREAFRVPEHLSH